MDNSSAIIAIAAALAIALSTIFPAIAQGKTAAAAMESIARQPDAAKDIRSALIISMALMEALTIYGLLIAFMLISKI
ncbi:MAG: ATP synthase F0 subunit C [Clostridia bacterium]|nr:ATP synthase F0 subunit C [Clostridia bacterium]